MADPDLDWSSLLTDPPERGTEGGIIMLDDEHSLGARITLESGGAGGAITCGIYGWMVHTRFFDSEVEARQAFAAMKIDLADILWRIPLKSDPELDAKMDATSGEISAFVDKYP